MDDSHSPHDAELQALLSFTPVPRRTTRHDGWSPELQRDYIAALAATGDIDLAAQSVGRTMSGAYRVRKSAGAAEFAEAWDKAMALYRARNPPPPPAPPPFRAPPSVRARGSRPEPEPETDLDARSAEDEHRWKTELFEGMMQRYVLKLDQERKARLAGRIAEADFYVRQLTMIEIGFDLGGEAHTLLKRLERRDLGILDIAATPISVMLDGLRRRYWAEKGEPDRPPLSPLGAHDGEAATGEPTYHMRERDGDFDEWRHRQKEQQAFAAEAQRAWEEKARADAEAWRARVEADDE